jgi:hypothetical protein
MKKAAKSILEWALPELVGATRLRERFNGCRQPNRRSIKVTILLNAASNRVL